MKGPSTWRRSIGGLGALILPVVAMACGSGGPSKYPAQKAGCEVQTFEEGPTVKTDNIGTVTARCDDFVPDEECLRTLKDEACKLGADVVWGIGDKPRMDLGKKVWNGRAAKRID
jgi:hypothetical protein